MQWPMSAISRWREVDVKGDMWMVPSKPPVSERERDLYSLRCVNPSMKADYTPSTVYDVYLCIFVLCMSVEDLKLVKIINWFCFINLFPTIMVYFAGFFKVFSSCLILVEHLLLLRGPHSNHNLFVHLTNTYWAPAKRKPLAGIRNAKLEDRLACPSKSLEVQVR